MRKMVYDYQCDVDDNNYNIEREDEKKWQNKIDKRRKVKQNLRMTKVKKGN